MSKKNFFPTFFNKIDNGRYKELPITAKQLKAGRIFLKKWLQDTKN